MCLCFLLVGTTLRSCLENFNDNNPTLKNLPLIRKGSEETSGTAPVNSLLFKNLTETATEFESESDDNKLGLSYIDVSNVSSMSELFKSKTTSSGGIECWDVLRVKNIGNMFNGA